MLPLQHDTVVVPVDFSEDSVAAIRSGLARVKDPSGLHVVTVLVPLDLAASSLQREYSGGEAREEVARRRLEELIAQTGAAGAKAVVLTGDPGFETADYAKKVNAAQIVVPSHGYHGVKRLLLGSTAERILRYAPCSVLVLRRRDAD